MYFDKSPVIIAVTDYERVQYAIEYLQRHQQAQPSLNTLADFMGLSAGHVQKLFLKWTGLTPKRFLQTLTLEHAKSRLLNDAQSVFDAAIDAGLSSASRLYDHFINIEAMTPGDYRRQGAGTVLQWGQVNTPFGDAFIGFSEKGVCKLSFIDQDDIQDHLGAFQAQWSFAEIKQNKNEADKLAEKIFSNYTLPNRKPISLCIQGTNFQVAVWRALLAIPEGRCCSYSDIAFKIKKPQAVRAVGTAVGANPIACLIPCHRVIRQTGALGGYRWGIAKKQMILAKEYAASVER